MEEKKYKLGLALSGGGAKGAAHCGVLQALHEFGIRPDVVAGTSAGSIAGALYCAGVAPVEMINKFMKLDFKDLIGISKPTAGFFDQSPLVDYLREFIPVKNFEDLQLPFYAVACDLDKGKVKVFDSGELAPRIMASCSIPIFFQPTVVDGIPYVDGGVFKNLPVSVLRADCEKVLAVSVHATTEGYKNNLLSVSMRIFHMLLKANTLEDANDSDLYLELNTSQYSQFDLGNIQELFKLGYDETVQVLEKRGYTRQMEPEKLTFDPKPKRKPEQLHDRLVQSNLYVKLTDLIETVHKEGEEKLKEVKKKRIAKK